MFFVLITFVLRRGNSFSETGHNGHGYGEGGAFAAVNITTQITIL